MKSGSENRPVIKLKISKAGYLLEIAAILGLIAMWTLAVTAYINLPEIIPTHFGINGKADDWGNKTSIFILPAISSVLIIGLTILNRYPHIFNYPVNVTKENAMQLYHKATILIRIIKVFIVVLFLFIEWQVCDVSGNDQLPRWFLPIILTVPVLLPIIMSFILSNKSSSGKSG